MYDAASETPIVSLGMVNWVAASLRGGSDLIGIGTFPLFESQGAAGPNPGIQVTAMKAPAVADLHVGGAVRSLT
jgi:hypothetical protein